MTDGGYSRTEGWNLQLQAQVVHLKEQNAALLSVLEGLEPYLDAIVCYASTMEEHAPNRLVVNARAAIAAAKGESKP